MHTYCFCKQSQTIVASISMQTRHAEISIYVFSRTSQTASMFTTIHHLYSCTELTQHHSSPLILRLSCCESPPTQPNSTSLHRSARIQTTLNYFTPPLFTTNVLPPHSCVALYFLSYSAAQPNCSKLTSTLNFLTCILIML